jgi:hypothetical protein
MRIVMMRIVMTFFLIMPEKLSNFKVLVVMPEKLQEFGAGRCRRANTTTTEGIAGTPSAAGVCGERTNENM